MIIKGRGGGCINVLDEHFPYVAEHDAVIDMLHMLSDALLLDFLREPILLVLNKWMVHGSTSKNGDLCRCSTKKNQQVYKKDTLGPTAGHGVTMLPCCSLWLLSCHKRSGTEASRRGKNWMSECRPDMIRMIENHRILFFLPLKSKIESPRRRNANFHS